MSKSKKGLLRGFRAGFWSAFKSSQAHREPLRKATIAVVDALERRVFLTISGFTATTHGGEIDLSWSPVSGATGYTVQRTETIVQGAPGSGASYLSPVAYTLGSFTSPSCSDTDNYQGLPPNTALTYQVFAEGVSDEGDVTVSTDAASASPVGGSSISVYTGQPITLSATTNELDSASANVAFGDGNTQGNVAANVDWDTDTAYLAATYAYSAPGTYNASFSITDNAGDTVSTSQTVTVSNASVAITVDSIHAVAGEGIDEAIATVATPATTLDASDFTGTITWGDGATSAATFSDGPSGQFYVTGSHVYSSTGNESISVTVTGGGTTTTGSSDADITRDTPTGLAVSGTPLGSEISLSWTAVSGATGYQIFRGISDDPDSLSLLDTAVGTNSYTDNDLGAGLEPDTTYYYAVKAIDSGSTSLMSSPISATTASFAITPPPATTLTLCPGDTLTLTLTNNDMNNPVETLNWGDGSGTDSSQTSEWHDTSGNEYSTFSHVYSDVGQYTANFTLTTQSGQSLTETFTVDVESSVELNVPAIVATDGVPVSGTIANFADDSSTYDAYDCTVSIAWGDGTTTPGTIVGGPNSQWYILGMHTYTSLVADGGDTITVTVDGITPSIADGSAPVTVVAPPTVATAAAASVSSDGTYINLSVLGGPSDAEGDLTYTWTETAGAGGSSTPIFDDGGDNSAQNARAYLSAIGTYTFEATITNAAGDSVTSAASPVTVSQVATSINVTPASAVIAGNTTQQFAASEVDQFGNAMATQPTFTWNDESGGEGGTISSSGNYTAGSAAGADTIDVTDSGNTWITGQGSVYVATSAAAQPSGLTATAAETAVVLSWDAQQDAATYNVYRGTSSGGESTTPIATGLTQPTYTDTGRTDGTTYYYTVTAVNPVGEGLPSTEVNAIPTQAAPTGVTATPGDNSIDLSWNPALGATSYDIFAGSSSGGEGTAGPYVAGITGTSYVDNAATSGAITYYTVEAVYPSGVSEESAEVSAEPETSAPGAPTGLTAIANGDNAIDLSWTAPSSDGTDPVDQYIIERSTDGSNFSELTSVSGSETTYEDTPVSVGTTYYYQVYACNALGQSGDGSNIANVSTPVGAPDIPIIQVQAKSDSEIDVRVEMPANSATGFVLEMAVQGSNNFATVLDGSDNALAPEPVDGQYVFQVTDLAPNTKYSFRVGAILNGLIAYAKGSAKTLLAPGPDGRGPATPGDASASEQSSAGYYIATDFSGSYDSSTEEAAVQLTGDDTYHVEGNRDNEAGLTELSGDSWEADTTAPFTPYGYNVQVRVYDPTPDDPDAQPNTNSSLWSATTSTEFTDPRDTTFPPAPDLTATPEAGNIVQVVCDNVPTDGTYGLELFRLLDGVATRLEFDPDGASGTIEGTVAGGPTGSQIFGFLTEQIANSDTGKDGSTSSDYYGYYSNFVSDEGIPLVPKNLTATFSPGGVHLLWENTPNDETGFTVERYIDTTEDGTAISPFKTFSTDADVPYTTDKGSIGSNGQSYFLEGQTYHYIVQSNASPTSSAFSSQASVTIPEEPMTCSGGQLSADGDQSNGSDPSLTSLTGDWSASATISTTGSTTGTTGGPQFIAQLDGGEQITAVYGPGEQTFFNYNSTDHTYSETYGGTDTLVDTGSQFILTDSAGNKSYFSDSFTLQPDGYESAVQGTADAAGNAANVISRNAAGNITEVHIVNADDVTAEDWDYSYISSGEANAGLLQSVTQKIYNGSSFTTYRVLDYTYYDGSNSDGSAGDIRTATVTDGSGNVIQQEYYRYYVDGDSGGSSHQLKFQVGNDSLGRLEAAYPSTSLDSLTDAEIAPYADIYLAYNTNGQVATRTLQGEGCSSCAGGQGTYEEVYTTSGNAAGVNSWQYETDQTQPDGNQDITFYNSDGQTMLSIYKDTSTGQMSGTFTEYDSDGRAILTASPSAVDLPSSLSTIEAYPDLLDENSEGVYLYLSDHSGLITLTDYTSFNDVADTKIEQGQEGTPILQESMTYTSRTDSAGDTIYPVATDTTYSNTDGTGNRTTSYSYTWFSGTLQMASETTTLPVISSATEGDPGENGPGVADSSTDVYNDLGQVVWSKDANGYITYNAYDTATGALIETVQDVNLSDHSTLGFDTTYLPSSWSTPTGGGLDLVTTYQVDSLGRTTKETDPDEDVTYTVYNDALNSTTGFEDEVRTYPGWHYDSTLGEYTTTGPVTVTRTNVPGSYTESLTYAYSPVSGVTTPTGTDTIDSSNIQSLSRQLTSSGGQVIESDQYFNLSGVTYSPSTFHLGTANVNYYATTYGYDTDGNQNKVVDPNGTITRTVYDGQGRVVSTWVGTNDTPTSGWWSPTNNAGSNMVEVSSNVYDNGGVGDGDLTETIQYPDGTTGERATLNYYDWQDRLVATKTGALVNSDGSPDPSAETDGVNRPITYTTYDNLDEPIEQDTYDGDGVSITSTDGVPNAPSSSLLVAKTDTGYDDQGRVYQTQQYSVTPGTGAVSSTALASETFYDHDGNVIAQSSPSGQWTKYAYDGADRPIATYVTDGGVLSGAAQNWTDADSVANDVVLSETDTIYDADGNVITTYDRERLPDDPQTGSGSTGQLGFPDSTSEPAATSYVVETYYDDADRPIASVNLGASDGGFVFRPETIPDSDDTTLVTTTAYGADGLPSIVTDPRGIESLTEYDLLGRTTETIAAYTDGTPTSDTNQTTLYTYDGDGNETTMTAVQPSGTPNQTTDYIYGTSSTSDIFSNDLLAKVEYPDATTGDASTSAANDVTYTYDALGETTSMTDQNGTTHDYAYDSLGRQTLDSVITLGSGVDGSVRALGTTYNAQGLPYQETSYSNANGTGVVNQDQDVYNGLGQLTGEYQSVSGAVNTSSTPEVQYGYSDPSTGSVQTSMTYPNGRVIDYVYNAGIDATIGRVSAIADAGGSDAGTLQSYTYQGLDTIVGETDGNGVTETTTLDPFGRTAELKYVNGAGTTTDDFQYGYDRDGNVLYEDNLLDSSESQLYHSNSTTTGDDNSAYDPLNRLTGFEEGTLSASGDNGSTLDTVSSPNASQSWSLNAVGDQNSVTTGNTTVSNTSNAKNELTANGEASLTYDNDGNTLTDENGITYTYDAWNRQVTAKNSGNTTIATYSYDPNGRRITDTESGTTTDIYYTNQWQDIEERQSGTVTRQNVWGLAYVNQLVERDDNSAPGNLGITGSGLGERFYAQQDINWSVTSLVENGNVVQRMTYAPYGVVTFLTASWLPTTDAYSQNVLFQGGRLETATGIYIFDSRDYEPNTGTWLEMDPTGYRDGASLYLALKDAPTVRVDPTGLLSNPTPPSGFVPFTDADQNALIGTRQRWVTSLADQFPNDTVLFSNAHFAAHGEVTPYEVVQKRSVTVDGAPYISYGTPTYDHGYNSVLVPGQGASTWSRTRARVFPQYTQDVWDLLHDKIYGRGTAQCQAWVYTGSWFFKPSSTVVGYQVIPMSDETKIGGLQGDVATPPPEWNVDPNDDANPNEVHPPESENPLPPPEINVPTQVDD